MANEVIRISKKIGLKIKLLRNKIGISQEELGFRANISKTQIGLIERGESSPTIDTLDQIAHALDISLVDLVDTSKIDLG
jgi:transcriptional regulator with XRE-family HTH domain